MIALLFDMDGVIVDSNPMHRRAWEVFNRRYGVETTLAMHERMYGKRNDEIVRDFFGDALSAEEVAARGYAKEALYREMVSGQLEEMLVPGLRPFLERYRNLPMGVASNAEPENVSLFLQGTGLLPYFGAVVDGHQVERPKPFPDIYLRAAEILKTDAADCVVFEDSHSGVAAGRAAGMRVIGLCTTHDNLPGTSLNVDNFLSKELESWLQSLVRSA
jgi:beta-phosphoglucomutase